jgi:antitoxin (DNA-binding transcriptional repressor) of toxin-antitoxin stability system
MTTITAVELRKNMGEIFRRVRAGEQIAVTYRDQDPIILASQKQSEKGKKSVWLALMRSMRHRVRSSILTPTNPTKKSTMISCRKNTAGICDAICRASLF